MTKRILLNIFYLFASPCFAGSIQFEYGNNGIVTRALGNQGSVQLARNAVGDITRLVRTDQNPDDDDDSISDINEINALTNPSRADTDGDGVTDDIDEFARNRGEFSDTDGDGVGDNSDPDIDGDGTPNSSDRYPRDPFESSDADNDGIGDRADPDDDNDLIPDHSDRFPFNGSEAYDCDSDGTGDNLDTTPCPISSSSNLAMLLDFELEIPANAQTADIQFSDQAAFSGQHSLMVSNSSLAVPTGFLNHGTVTACFRVKRLNQAREFNIELSIGNGRQAESITIDDYGISQNGLQLGVLPPPVAFPEVCLRLNLAMRQHEVLLDGEQLASGISDIEIITRLRLELSSLTPETSVFVDDVSLRHEAGQRHCDATGEICDSDWDLDGISDEREQLLGLNPNDSADALLDSDSDGSSNLNEILLGTNPLADDVPPLLTVPDNLSIVIQSPSTVLDSEPRIIQWLNSATAVDFKDGVVGVNVQRPAALANRLVDGMHEFVFESRDSAGNKSIARRSLAITVEVPGAMLSGVMGAASNQLEWTILWDEPETPNVQTLIQLHGTSLNEYSMVTELSDGVASGVIKLEDLPPGTYNASLLAFDGTSFLPLFETIVTVPDRMPPDLTVPAALAVFIAEPAVCLDVSDTRVQAFLAEPVAQDNYSVPRITNNLSLGCLPIGTTEITFYATDENGNRSEATTALSVEQIPAPIEIKPPTESPNTSIPIVDITPPQLSYPNLHLIIETENLAGITSGHPALGEWLDGVSAIDELDGALPVFAEISQLLPIGNHQILIQARDVAANTASAILSLEVKHTDTIPPDLSVPADLSLLVMSESSCVEKSEPAVQAFLEAASSSDLTARISHSQLPNCLEIGVHPVQFQSEDEAGNKSTASRNISIQILTRATNLSTRGKVSRNDEVMIGGMIIDGQKPLEVLIRLLGPTLSRFGLPNTLSDPYFEIYDADGQFVASNDDWNFDVPQALMPENRLESGLRITLEPGAYTVVSRGVNKQIGSAIVEIYTINPNDASRLINLSTRGPVGTGHDVLICGIIAKGDTDIELTFRARGESLTLADPNLSGQTLKDPTLTVFDVDGNAIATSNNWLKNSTDARFYPEFPEEAAITLTLQPGAYTAVVSGADGGTGIGICEVIINDHPNTP